MQCAQRGRPHSGCGNHRRRGFTLSELLVAMAVASIFVVLVYQVFVSQQRVQTVQQDVNEAQQNARVAVDALTRAVSSIGAQVDRAGGQVRILMAHPNQLLFTADLDAATSAAPALPAGTNLTGVDGYTSDAPYAAVPGSYTSSPAETYRLYLRPDTSYGSGAHHSLMREKNLNAYGRREIAMLLANERLGVPLFSYYGQFDSGSSAYSTLHAVNRATSSRVAAGAPLEAVIERIDIQVITETPYPDPRLAQNDGYRQTILNTSIAPRNVWDCPVIQPVGAALTGLEAPSRRGATDTLSFRVTRGGVVEVGHTVHFAMTNPAGTGYPYVFGNPAGTATSATTDASGVVTAYIVWPDPDPSCALVTEGTYSVSATTSAVTTPFATCTPQSAQLTATLARGRSEAISFTPDPVPVDSCGDKSDAITFNLWDGCGLPAEASGATVEFSVSSGSVDPPSASGVNTGTVEYTSPDAPSGPARDATEPIRLPPLTLTATDTSTGASGQTTIETYTQPATLEPGGGQPLGSVLAGAALSDCPAGSATEIFEIWDTCGNRVHTLVGNWPGTPDYHVTASVGSSFGLDVGTLASTNNPTAVPGTTLDIRQNDGTPGQFDVTFTPRTCGLGAAPRDAQLTLTPSWDASNAAGPLPFTVENCNSCAVAVQDASGTPVTHLNRECSPFYDVVVTHCDGPGEVELVLEPIVGTPPSFDAAALVTQYAETFTPVNGVWSAHARLYMGWADASSSFRIRAYMPSQAAVQALDPSAVECVSADISVDTTCEELLISDSAAHRGAVPANNAPEDTPICGLAGQEVWFRVKDCDQNWSGSADDMTNLAGRAEGIRVEVWAYPNGPLLEEEEVDVLREVDADGNPALDQPYFQGRLVVTQDPNDPAGNGLIHVPEGQPVELRAYYQDPSDPTDIGCIAYALLLPPLPVCILHPLQSHGDLEGDPLVRGGDAVVAGDLNLPASPSLLPKKPSDPYDRFFNAYIGGRIREGGTLQGSSAPLDQPYGQYPNYFQNVPDSAALLTRLDYQTLKDFAIARRVYWEYASSSGLISNPHTGAEGTFQEVTALPGPGQFTSNHPRAFLFVDAPAGLQSGGVIDSTELGELPHYSVAGDYYTEGLIYVAGSVTLNTSAGGQPVPRTFAAGRDERYDEAGGGLTRDDLPVTFDSSLPAAAGTRSVHWNGVLYAEGEVVLAGSPEVYGAVIAERGVRASASSQLWYDPSWMETRLEPCVECCGLSISPTAPTLQLGATLQLAADYAQGAVVWESLDSAVVAVDGSGLAAAVETGNAVVRATDAAGCVAEAELRVDCGLTLNSSAGTELTPGDLTNISASGAQGVVDWVSDNPATLSLNGSSGISLVGTAGGVGGAQITATDTRTTPAGPASCSATLDFVVNCPDGRGLAVDPANPTPGQTVTLAVLEASADVSDQYVFFADGAPLASQSYTFATEMPVAFTATLDGGTCPLGPVTVTPHCPTYSMEVSPTNPAVGTPAYAVVFDSTGQYVSSSISFSVEPATAAKVQGFQIVPVVAGTLQVSGTDPEGCPVGPVQIEAIPAR